jgi:putative transcriptional regulator
MRSLKGNLILDSGKLADSPFCRAVVLVCQHDHTGAFGLVLNQPSDHKVGRALEDPLPELLKRLTVFVGGPVQPQALTCLMRVPLVGKGGDDESVVLPGLRVTHSLTELGEPRDELPAEKQFKFFAGYSGWSPGQLDNEMKQEAWVTHPSSMDLIFTPRPNELWRKILLAKGPEYRLLAETPEDVSRN